MTAKGLQRETCDLFGSFLEIAFDTVAAGSVLACGRVAHSVGRALPASSVLLANVGPPDMFPK